MFFSASDSRPVTKTFDGPVEKLRKGLRKNGMKTRRKEQTCHFEADTRCDSGERAPHVIPRSEGTRNLPLAPNSQRLAKEDPPEFVREGSLHLENFRTAWSRSDRRGPSPASLGMTGRVLSLRDASPRYVIPRSEATRNLPSGLLTRADPSLRSG